VKFIHISDQHNHGALWRNRIQSRFHDGLRQFLNTHILIDTGDISDDGFKDQYKIIQDAMAPWLGKWYFCPGNHDFGIAGLFYDPASALLFDEMLSGPFGQGGVFRGMNAPVVNMVEDGRDRVMLIALDSNLETPDPWDFACGEIGSHQLTALSAILNDAPDEVVKIVFMHHHPWMHWHPFMRLLDAQSLLMRLRGRIDVLLFGHRHEEGMWRGKWNIPLSIAAPSSPQVPWVREIVVEKGEVSTNVIQWREGA
jgi:3',5'-cyclic AMP phosphodiesterase CpdA